MVKLAKAFVLCMIGGWLYYSIELLWRGYSHWSMFIVGGIAFLLIGGINEFYPWSMPLFLQCGIAAGIITILEFVAGCIVNLWLRWDVWHYTVLDILGQVSLPFIGLWYLLGFAGIILDDWLRWRLFDEEKPHYKLI